MLKPTSDREEGLIKSSGGIGDSLDSCLLITKGEGGLLHLKFWFLSKPSLGRAREEDRLALQEDFGSNIKNIQILPRGNDNKGGVGEQSIVGLRREGG